MVDPAEPIASAAVREVKEETGIDTEFIGVTAIHEGHNRGASAARGPGTSDLYVVCALRAPTPTQPIQMQQSEIAACQWMGLDDLLQTFQAGTLFGEAFRAAADVVFDAKPCMHANMLPLGFVRASSMLYAPRAKL
eukprot:TRINITY_DN37803_c0_g1_i1.p1 TRINITY_DN37803_c0_g1~~TRINITY_DN37803_c0_g1_i1.p1  ORF type:complete len:136 (-),score=25.88 TRINITY_DN37803_c0_g1_i1:220-627(-)